MPAKADKIIVTNVSALKAKYKAHFSRVKKAVSALIAADKKRGVKTALVDLSSRAEIPDLPSEIPDLSSFAELQAFVRQALILVAE